MRTGFRRTLSRFKNTVSEELRCVRLPCVIAGAFLTAFSFGITVAAAWDDMCLCELVMPALTLSPFLTAVFRISAGAFLGAVLGFLIGTYGCSCRSLGAAVLVLMAIITELVWIPLLYSLTLPFLALIDLLLVGFLIMFAFFSMRFRFVTVMTVLAIHTVALIIRICFCVSAVSLN